MIEQLSDLRMFVLIASAGSLSEASRRASVSLASVSRRLASLENGLGVRLIDRGPRRFMLTEEGDLLLRRAGVILAEVDAASAELGAISGAIQGRLRISAPHEIGRRPISVLCSDFVNRHQQVDIELILTDDRPDVLEEDLDLAIQTKRPTSGDVIYRKLLSSRRVMCAAPSYLDLWGTPDSPEDLTRHSCILMRRGVRLYDRWTVRCDGQAKEIVVSGHLVSNSGDNIHAWALAGAGIAIKAQWDVVEDLQAGHLVQVLPNCDCDDVHLYATYHDRRHVPLRLRSFIDFLADRLLPWSGAKDAPTILTDPKSA